MTPAAPGKRLGLEEIADDCTSLVAEPDFVTTKTFRADAEDELREHLCGFHHVPPTRVLNQHP